MERLLHYIWKHRILPLRTLFTTDGREVEVLDPGLANQNQGPDFFNAKVRIGGNVWAGNVEVHVRSSDWFRHGHESDPAYNNTILHVVKHADGEVTTQDGHVPPQVELAVPGYVEENYHELCLTEDYPRCHRVVPYIPPLKVHAWMDALLAERIRERAARLTAMVDGMNGDWERATFVTLCRGFGFGLNGDTFEKWACSIPMGAAGKHRDDLLQVEALFLGMAGLLDTGSGLPDAGTERRKREFAFLAHKFSLTPAMDSSDWKYLRTRPRNFPHVRIRQIAMLYHKGIMRMSSLIEAPDIGHLDKALAGGGISAGSRRLLMINTIVPLLYAYGATHADEDMMQRALSLPEQIPAEDNHILRLWKQCGLTVGTAADSQALIQLKREYCDRKDCLRCRFAYEYLKMKH